MGIKIAEIERRQRRLEQLNDRMDLTDEDLAEFMDLCDWRRRMQEGMGEMLDPL